MYAIQSVLIRKSTHSLPQAKKWIIDHGFRLNMTAANFDTTNYYRFRQLAPAIVERRGMVRYRTICIDDKKGIFLIIAYS